MIHPPLHISDEIKTLNVVSTAFKNLEFIPVKYTFDGENINPALTIHGIPSKAKSLVLIVEDSDAPIKVWTHWIVWDILPSSKIKEKSIPGTEGINDFGILHYNGPCPPSGTHHYHYKVYALDEFLELPKGSSKIEVEKKMSTHLLAFGELVGLYKRAL